MRDKSMLRSLAVVVLWTVACISWATLHAAGTAVAASTPAVSIGTVKAAEGTDNQLYLLKQELAQDNVFLYPGAKLGLESEIREAYEDSNVAIVVIPSDESMESFDEAVENTKLSNGYEPDNFADAAYDTVKEDYDAVVVLSTNNVEIMGGGDGTDLLRLVEGSDAGNTERILLNQDKLEDYSHYEMREWGLIPLVILGIILLITIGYQVLNSESAFRWWLSDVVESFTARRKAKAAKAQAEETKRKAEARAREAVEAQRRQDAIVQPLSKDIPRDLRNKLDQMQRWASDNVAPKDREFALLIKTMVDRFQIMFQRLEERGTPQQRRMAMVEYNDMLEKISGALSERYYLDILAHPDLWDDPEGRIRQVKRAVAGASEQLLVNIKQVNASQDLDFQAALESLAGVMEAPKVADLYRSESEDQ